MNINDIPNIPGGPAAKFVAFIVAAIVSANYCIAWVKSGLKEPLTPSTFIATIFAMLMLIIGAYWLQDHPKKPKP